MVKFCAVPSLNMSFLAGNTKFYHVPVECGECAPCSVWKVNEGKWEHEFFGVIDYLIQQATFQRI